MLAILNCELSLGGIVIHHFFDIYKHLEVFLIDWKKLTSLDNCLTLSNSIDVNSIIQWCYQWKIDIRNFYLGINFI